MATRQDPPTLEGKTLLVCVGAMKAATSWLWARLRETPGVAASPLKEVYFFDARVPRLRLMDVDALAMRRLDFHLRQPGDPVDNLRARPAFRASVDRVRMIYDDEAYLAHFAAFARPGTRVLVDVTPAYAVIGRAGFAFMREHCARRGVALKALFVMREPVDRLWSHMRFQPQLDPAVDPLRDWPALLRDPAIMARSDYRATLEALDATFPPEDRLHLFHETLVERGFAQLCEALGLAAPSGGGEVRLNETPLKAPIPEEAARAFEAALAPQHAFCRARFGDDLPAAWRRD
jgi:hypothetical protein